MLVSCCFLRLRFEKLELYKKLLINSKKKCSLFIIFHLFYNVTKIIEFINLLNLLLNFYKYGCHLKICSYLKIHRDHEANLEYYSLVKIQKLEFLPGRRQMSDKRNCITFMIEGRAQVYVGIIVKSV